MDGKNNLLIRKGQSPDPDGRVGVGVVALYSVAYRALLEVVHSRLPTETVGALLGRAYRSEEEEDWTIVEDTVAIGTVPSGARLRPTESELGLLKDHLESKSHLSIVGWFCADPGIGIFAPRVDISRTQEVLTPGGGLFLLLNPARNEVAFWLQQNGSFTPVPGFYEVLPSEEATSIVPWTGVLSGGSEWLSVANGSPERSKEAEVKQAQMPEAAPDQAPMEPETLLQVGLSAGSLPTDLEPPHPIQAVQGEANTQAQPELMAVVAAAEPSITPGRPTDSVELPLQTPPAERIPPGEQSAVVEPSMALEEPAEQPLHAPSIWEPKALERLPSPSAPQKFASSGTGDAKPRGATTQVDQEIEAEPIEVAAREAATGEAADQESTQEATATFTSPLGHSLLPSPLELAYVETELMIDAATAANGQETGRIGAEWLLPVAPPILVAPTEAYTPPHDPRTSPELRATGATLSPAPPFAIVGTAGITGATEPLSQLGIVAEGEGTGLNEGSVSRKINNPASAVRTNYQRYNPRVAIATVLAVLAVLSLVALFVPFLRSTGGAASSDPASSTLITGAITATTASVAVALAQQTGSTHIPTLTPQGALPVATLPTVSVATTMISTPVYTAAQPTVVPTGTQVPAHQAAPPIATLSTIQVDGQTTTVAIGHAPTTTASAATSTHTSTPTLLVIGGESSILLQDSAFTGGYTNPDGHYMARTAQLIYGRGIQYSTMQARFNFNTQFGDPTVITVVGLDSTGSTYVPIQVTLNGTVVYRGTSLSRTGITPVATGNADWLSYSWQLAPGILTSGGNTLSITNLKQGSIEDPPLFALDYVTLK